MSTLGIVRAVAAIIFIIIFMISFKMERRRYRNAVYLGAGIYFAFISIMEFINPDESVKMIKFNTFTVIFMVMTLVAALALYIDTYKLIKKEGFGKSAMLTGVAATGIIALAVTVMMTLKYKSDSKVLLVINLTLLFILFFNAFVFSTFLIFMLIYSKMPVKLDCKYIIIHGAGLLDGHRVSKLLGSRIDKAIEVYEKCGRKAKIIASGGKGSDENLSEAEAIKGYLSEKGIPDEDIILEDKSTNTLENLRFSKVLIDRIEGNNSYKCIFVTSNYHVMRTAIYARKAGLTGECVGARTRLYYWISAFMREYAAILAANKIAAVLWIVLWWVWFVAENGRGL